MDAVTALTTVAGIALVVAIALEIGKRTLALTDEATKRYAPGFAAILGIALGVAGAVYFGNQPVEGAVSGYFGGATASGVYDQLASRFGL